MFNWLKNYRKTEDRNLSAKAPEKMPPLTTFRGWLRNHKPARNNVWGNAAFNLAFPGFAPPDWTEEAKREALAKSLPHVDRLFFQPSQHRRWGGYELDRGCYFSVARESSGDDSGTLSAELNAYRDQKRQDVIITATDCSVFADTFFVDYRIPSAIRKVRNSCIFISVFPASRLRAAYDGSEQTRDPQAALRAGQLGMLTEENLVHVMILPLVEWHEIPNVVGSFPFRVPPSRSVWKRI